jgi:hypothetical protein
MQTSRDVVFDERPFYLCPTIDASSTSLVNHLSFLLFLDAPPASLLIPHSTLPSSMSSTESPHAVSDYTVKPLVTVLQPSWSMLVRCSSFLGWALF